ncbi:hypothetical protein EUTSA_v10015727mg [Eutrema salsugineum]|uniref:DNA replication ATP-dependent helicase/nuclease n=1 Tax=Eutrema salsugineum TaxID=72664 RepID=V4LIP9_EUTSA|nr:hypothetical protein EUTSA_v10015727mg [Eutrema salsugineum]
MQLFIQNERSIRIRKMIVALEILTAKDYALILGMPGTGKTSTMVHAVKALLIRGSSILLASYTNSAVANLLIELKRRSFIPLGNLIIFLDYDSFIHL